MHLLWFNRDAKQEKQQHLGIGHLFLSSNAMNMWYIISKWYVIMSSYIPMFTPMVIKYYYIVLVCRIAWYYIMKVFLVSTIREIFFWEKISLHWFKFIRFFYFNQITYYILLEFWNKTSVYLIKNSVLLHLLRNLISYLFTQLQSGECRRRVVIHFIRPRMGKVHDLLCNHRLKMCWGYMGRTGQSAWRVSVETPTLALTIASWAKVYSLWPTQILDNDINHVFPMIRI